MTTVRPLNDDEVFNEMKKMAKIVRQESLNIEAVFERKIKQAEVHKRIAQSNHINKARLRTLHERQQVLDDLFDDARTRIHDLANDEEQYASLMENLVLQGAYFLMEPEVLVYCREADSEIVGFAAERATQTYEQTIKQSVTITISDEYLPASSAGGVLLTGLQGKIRVDNTLEARLDTVKEEMLPKLRTTLFGHSPNRRFFN
ncbi:V-ATPase V1 sector subunit E [Apophysomyces sp. BC1015]|nr:V-ATPase V1 sector subunit E [Apophysomyces sp. BC1015]